MNDVVVLDGRDFLIIDRVNLLGNNYIYAYALDDSDDYTILEESYESGKVFVSSITDDDLIEEVLKSIGRNELQE